ncbi:TonB-dependent receptor [soil metagenome]
MKYILLCSILLITSIAALAQNSIIGTVVFPHGKPAPYAVVVLQGTSLSTSTDFQGGFSFTKVKNGSYTLQCFYLGYADFSQRIEAEQSAPITITLKEQTRLTEEVIVNATRTSKMQGSTFTNLNKEEIKNLNTAQDVPYLLQSLPSTVVTSDAGNGIGYTGIRIRGSDPSRINVTINGIPINDAESQQMYWVDLPDFASSTENIQVQRGVGTSTNGAGAFGGSVNLLSNKIATEPYASSSTAVGTFSTLKNNISFGSGIVQDHFAFEGRLSKISSDGFIDRGASNLKSFYVGAGYYTKKSIIRFNIFSGHEITYQSWNGVPESRIEGDLEGMQGYIIRNGLNESEAANLLNSGRNYNFNTYDNQVDDYQQDHYQLLFSQQLNSKWLLNLAVHLTKGNGFYEEYKAAQELNDYGIQVDSNVSTISDLIRRKWLTNDFYGSTFSLSYEDNNVDQVILGGAVNRYDGDHFGDVIWAKNAGNSAIRHRYYFDNAMKDEVNIYGKWTHSFNEKVSTYVDLQYRGVMYNFEGANENGDPAPQSVNHNFFNPKAGVNWNINKRNSVYASIGVGNKEPNRDDYVDSPKDKYPKAESLIDFEIGYRYQHGKWNASLNNYFMWYQDQLVLTGKVNDVGNYTRSNINQSYRTGAEIEIGYTLLQNLRIDLNATFSQNKIKKYSDYLDTYDADYNFIGQTKTDFRNTDIAFSPTTIAAGSLTWNATKKLNIQIITKHISDQFLDNTHSKNRKIASYTVTDFRLSYFVPNKLTKELRFQLLLNNIFNTIYSSNGYTYGYQVGEDAIHENLYYPQARLNIMGQITLGF